MFVPTGRLIRLALAWALLSLFAAWFHFLLGAWACIGALLLFACLIEVLALLLDDESLSEPWVTRAAERLVSLLERTSDVDAECGGLYHAVHGLALYRRRICPDTAATQPPRPLLSAVDGR